MTEVDADQHAVLRRRVQAPPQAVWSVLADGWVYATWVVGTSRIRKVEGSWPAPGSQIHHSFGVWPAVIDDTSEVVACDPGRELVLRARGWPIGEAQVRIRLEEPEPGVTEVSIVEDVVRGPARWVAPRLMRQVLIAPRNVETLRRLAHLAEGRHRGT